MIDIKDTGRFTIPALLQPDLYHGKNFTCATAFYTLVEMVDTWTKVTGRAIRFQQTGDSGEYSTLSEAQKHELKKAGCLITKYSYFGPTGKQDLSWTGTNDGKANVLGGVRAAKSTLVLKLSNVKEGAMESKCKGSHYLPTIWGLIALRDRIGSFCSCSD